MIFLIEQDIDELKEIVNNLGYQLKGEGILGNTSIIHLGGK